MTAPAGFFAHARALLASLLEVGQTRLQLASVELEEERARIAELLIWATAALFFLGLGIVFVALLVVLLCWNGPREWVLGGFALLFVGLGVGAGLGWRHRLLTKPAFMAATIAELQRDHAALREPPP